MAFGVTRPVTGRIMQLFFAALLIWGGASVAEARAQAGPAPSPSTPAEAAGPTTPASKGGVASPPAPPPAVAEMTMADFLDRLMIAESGGNNQARNPKSTAVGPFQFIEGTWIAVMRQHFAKETEGLAQDKLLALRTDRSMARRAAEAFTKDNAAFLTANGVAATYTNLRLAFLVGAAGAVRVLKAKPEERAVALLGPGVGRANPFMYGLTAAGLIARSARDLQLKASSTAAMAAGDIPTKTGAAGGGARKEPQIAVSCNLSLPSCRRWLALAKSRAMPAKKRAARAQ